MNEIIAMYTLYFIAGAIDYSHNFKNGMLCTNSLCASYVEKAIQDM